WRRAPVLGARNRRGAGTRKAHRRQGRARLEQVAASRLLGGHGLLPVAGEARPKGRPVLRSICCCSLAHVALRWYRNWPAFSRELRWDLAQRTARIEPWDGAAMRSRAYRPGAGESSWGDMKCAGLIVLQLRLTGFPSSERDVQLRALAERALEI